MKPAITNKDLTFEKELSWEEVFNAQIDREGKIWDKHWKESGYSSLKDWRNALLTKYGYDLFNLDRLEWKQFTIKNPAKTASLIHSGLYQGWAKYRNDEKRRASPYDEHLENEAFVASPDFEKRISALGTRPRETGIALRDPVSNKVVLVDGHHTVGAFAKLYATGRSTDATLELHLADISTNQHSLFEKWMAGEIPISQ